MSVTTAVAPVVPAELLVIASTDIGYEFDRRERLAELRPRLEAEREELAQASRGKTHFTGGETEEEAAIIHRRIETVARLQTVYHRLDDEVRGLEGAIWSYDDDVLRAAAKIAQKRESCSSVEIGGEILQLEERRNLRREAVAESEALLAATKSELADLEDAQERRGEDHRKAIAKLESRSDELDRQVRARRTAFDREVDETEPALAAWRAALPVAAEREYELARADLMGRIHAGCTALSATVADVRAKVITALTELDALNDEGQRITAEISRATGVGYTWSSEETFAARQNAAQVLAGKEA